MERLLSWMRENPQFAGLLFFSAVLIVVMSTLAFAMRSSGVSLRPLIWFGGFFAIVAGPQMLVHLFDGFIIRQSRAAVVASPNLPVTSAGPEIRPVPWAVVFGPKADPSLITDAKRGLSAILESATEAKLSFNTDGESALAARFASNADAAKARDIYGTFFVFADAVGSDRDGWTARRHAGQGEWVHLVTAGPELYAWTAATREGVVKNRTRALGPISERTSLRTAAGATAVAPNLVSERLRKKTGLMIAIVSLNVLAASLWFFKGSSWSARIDARSTEFPDSASALRARLVAVNETDVRRR